MPFVKAINKEIWHLTISFVRSCQYVLACQNSSIYSKWLKIKRFSQTDNGRTDGHGGYRTLLVSPTFE